jgi:hypothetical protein
MNTPTIRFPALAIAKDSILPIQSIREECTEAALREKYFDGLRYFDSNGMIWDVVEAVPQREPSPTKGPFGSRLRVQLRFGTPHPGDLAQIKDQICREIDRDPDDLYDQSSVPSGELKAMIQAADTAAQVIECFVTLGESQRPPSS